MGSDPKILQAPAGQRVHVVHVVTSLEPGGLENGVVNLANRLDRDRFRVSIVCLERLGEFAHRLKPDVGLHCLEKPPGFKWRAGIQLGETLGRLEPDIVHTHNLGPLLYGVIGRMFGRSGGVIVQGEHAQLRDDEKMMKKRWLRRACYRRCAAVHAVSVGLREELVAFEFPSEKVRVIFNGVDCERFSPADSGASVALRRQNGIPPSSFVIGMAGRFGSFKRHDRLIGAFNNLAGRYPDLRLLMIGDHGPEKERVLSLREQSEFRDRISWAGFQNDPAPWYQMMDLLVIPSENEGLSNVMLEAMATGVPCLAHPACGAAEVIRDGQNGLLRPLGSEDRLENEIESLVGNPGALPEMGKRARKTALKRFSFDAMLDGYSNLYEDVLPATRR